MCVPGPVGQITSCAPKWLRVGADSARTQSPLMTNGRADSQIACGTSHCSVGSAMKRTAIVVLFSSALALAGDAPKRRLAEPDYLPALARQLLRNRMQRHGTEMVDLVMAVTLLQRERAKALADDIAGEPRLTRPI